jgi:transmembrane 9 superfamily member 2/4
MAAINTPFPFPPPFIAHHPPPPPPGTGLQLLCMAVITIGFAAVGFLSPANRGSLVIAVLVLYVMMGAVAGYSSARLYKTFKGKEWQKCTMYTAFLFPGICFLVFVGFNIILSFYHSTAAIPMLSLVALVVSTPPVFT